ncbi:MAG: SpoIID/LytB domain-containing protein, partial [Planctomycetota bacterium]
PAILIRPKRGGDLDIAGTRYQGGLLLSAEKGDRLVASNLVEVEEYVAGVLLSEMPERFGQEALRAQAVVARTFALYQSRAGRTLRDDQGSQVYAGLRKVDDEVRRIVHSTMGEVLTFEGEILESYFHSTCGGVTCSAAGVFGIKRPPPLEGGGVCRDCRNSPHYHWTRDIPLACLAELYGGSFGSALELEVESRLPSGRAETLVIRDRSGKKQDRLMADRFRSSFNAGRPLKEQLPSMFIESIERFGSSLRITGKGFGHGVGLCQYGAGGMAGRGAGYREILSRYYPGAVIHRIYD